MSEARAVTAPVENLLSQFPGPVTLYPSRTKWAILAAASLMFVMIGILFILDDTALWGWVDLVFSGACLLVSAVRLLPGAASLTLDAGGFEERTLFFRLPRARWRNITNIEADAAPAARSDVKLVRYNDTQPTGSWLEARRETAMLGYNAALADTYGLSAEDLADLLVRWQQQALAAERHSEPRPVDLLI